MSGEFFRIHPNFEANLSFLYMAPTTYKLLNHQDHNYDHYVAYASKHLEKHIFRPNLEICFVQFLFNFLKSTQPDSKSSASLKHL